jgi:hypothetical protein
MRHDACMVLLTGGMIWYQGLGNRPLLIGLVSDVWQLVATTSALYLALGRELCQWDSDDIRYGPVCCNRG